MEVTADGCVQTGGHGDTWKRYVNPSDPDGKDLYHGMIRIPTGTKESALVKINSVMENQILVTGAGIEVSQLVLSLGYQDDNYSDNGYAKHDDGTDDQCKDVPGHYGGPAYVNVRCITTSKTVAKSPKSIVRSPDNPRPCRLARPGAKLVSKVLKGLCRS